MRGSWLKYPSVQRHGIAGVRAYALKTLAAGLVVVLSFGTFSFQALAGIGPSPPPEKPLLEGREVAPREVPIVKPPALPAAKRCRSDEEPFEVGEASHYADVLAGYRTAFGGRYDPERLTAAHRTLPNGARILVRNMKNGRSAVVTVTDRGPFTHTRRGPSGLPRIVDLSGRAAQVLGFRGGVARVEIFRCGG